MTCLTNQAGPALGPAHRAQLLSSSLLETLFILRHLSSDGGEGGRTLQSQRHSLVYLFPLSCTLLSLSLCSVLDPSLAFASFSPSFSPSPSLPNAF